MSPVLAASKTQTQPPTGVYSTPPFRQTKKSLLGLYSHQFHTAIVVVLYTLNVSSIMNYFVVHVCGVCFYVFMSTVCLRSYKVNKRPNIFYLFVPNRQGYIFHFLARPGQICDDVLYTLSTGKKN